MPEKVSDAGSFRDAAGRIYHLEGRVFRTVTRQAIDAFHQVRATGLLGDLVRQGKLVGWHEIEDKALWPPEDAVATFGDVATVLEHTRIPFISYPYEWSFSALKAAAVLHLDVHLQALQRDCTLVDATAFNIQFVGHRPLFIDHLSFRPYQEGEFWLGQQQFCDQFLVPLLMGSEFGLPHNHWYRGAQEGIPGSVMASLLPWYRRWLPKMIMHVTLPAYFERRAIAKGVGTKGPDGAAKKGSLPKKGLVGILNSLRRWIAGMNLKGSQETVWSDYEDNNIYTEDEAARKRNFVAKFAQQTKPSLLWDLGCNTGAYSEVALAAGAEGVIGFEYDMGALEAAYVRAREKDLNFLPIYLDAANPSPSQGWFQRERMGLAKRAPGASGLIALALVHHIAIGRNVPLGDVVTWLVSLAPKGVIEFVPKDDPMVRELLKNREDIFNTYSKETFLNALGRVARVSDTETVTRSGRLLARFDRS